MILASRRRWSGGFALAAGALALAVMTRTPAVAAPASAWGEGQHSAARLLDGGEAAPGRRLAGLEIRLDPGFITYWRSPGEAGVPPAFDFSASLNLKEARVDYPSPSLIDEDGAQAYGYRQGVTLPISVVPRDPSAPVTLDLVLDYAVCARLCLPAKARLSLVLDGSAATDGAPIRAAMAAVPAPVALGAPGRVRIEAVTRAGATALDVEAVVPEGVGTLFVEAPDPWYFSAGPGRPGPDGRLAFTLTGPDRPPPGPSPLDPLRLTLVTPSGAIEVPVRLDAVSTKP